MGSLMRKTQRRVETIVSWVLAVLFLVLVAAGAYWLVTLV